VPTRRAGYSAHLVMLASSLQEGEGVSDDCD
jgi:hypothetical protein